VDGRGLKRILGNFDLECGREGVGGTRGDNCKIPRPRRGAGGRVFANCQHLSF
jgi:hypothetical protein